MRRFISVDNQRIPVNKEGYLQHLDDWSQAAATQIAANENIELSDNHWEIIYSLRDFYQRYELSPAMRPFVKHIASQLGKDKGNSLYLLKLFPQSPAKLASKIAGLPKPTNCL